MCHISPGFHTFVHLHTCGCICWCLFVWVLVYVFIQCCRCVYCGRERVLRLCEAYFPPKPQAPCSQQISKAKHIITAESHYLFVCRCFCLYAPQTPLWLFGVGRPLRPLSAWADLTDNYDRLQSNCYASFGANLKQIAMKLGTCIVINGACWGLKLILHCWREWSWGLLRRAVLLHFDLKLN